MTAAAIAAIRLRREREIVAALRAHNAFSPGAAISNIEPDGVAGHAAFRALLRSGAVIEAKKGAYYLDETGYAASRERRRLRVVAALAIVLLAALAAALLTARG